MKKKMYFVVLAGLAFVFFSACSDEGDNNNSSAGNQSYFCGTINGESNKYVTQLRLDINNNAYTTGFFKNSVDFDPTPNVDTHTATEFRAFINKISADGNYVWTKTFGGTADVYGKSIALDLNGNIYLTGHFKGTADFNPGAGIDTHTAVGGSDIFITKIYSDGTYAWTKTIGGTSPEQGKSVAIDSLGNIYVSGVFEGSVDFDPSSGVDNHTSNGNDDIFITKILANGTYGWTKTFGGSANDLVYSIKTDSANNIYLTGGFQNTVDFDPSASTDTHTSNGMYDIFILKIAANGSYLWTKTMGGSSSDFGRDIALDSSGNIYLAGDFCNSVDFNPGTGVDNRSSIGENDIFLTKIDASSTYVWTQTFGGVYFDNPHKISLDSDGNIYLTGRFQVAVDFNSGTATDKQNSNGGYDAFITKIYANGKYGWTKTYGGIGYDSGNGIAVDNKGSVWASGAFNKTALFHWGTGQTNYTSTGGGDIFIIKMPNN